MISFANSGVLDPVSISTFGVSVKDTENPIGFFGTGLKYALAVLLRMEQRVTIHTGGKVYKFSLAPAEVRGKAFHIVTMYVQPEGEAPSTPTPLGFTTELGKHWELWMAYRELACNCLDEQGVIYEGAEQGEKLKQAFKTQPDNTCIFVEGDDFHAVFARRQDYILESTAQAETPQVELHRGESTSMFYRRVRVAELEKPSIFTYNLKTRQDLTEDRTLRSMWEIPYILGGFVQKLTDPDLIREIVIASDSFFENSFMYPSVKDSCSEEFLQVLGELGKTKVNNINPSAWKSYKAMTKKNLDPTHFTLSSVQEQMLDRAKAFCEGLGCDFAAQGYEIHCVEDLGTGVLGLALAAAGAEPAKIFITRENFTSGGTKCVALTLLEEYTHLVTGHADCTRGLQQHLFDRLISMGEELRGVPL